MKYPKGRVLWGTHEGSQMEVWKFQGGNGLLFINKSPPSEEWEDPQPYLTRQEVGSLVRYLIEWLRKRRNGEPGKPKDERD